MSQTRDVEQQILEMEHRLRPVTTMWNTVKLSDQNIGAALGQIEEIHNKVSAIETTLGTLRQKKQVLAKDPRTFFETILRACDLVSELEAAQKNKDLLSIYKDVQGKDSELR